MQFLSFIQTYLFIAKKIPITDLPRGLGLNFFSLVYASLDVAMTTSIDTFITRCRALPALQGLFLLMVNYSSSKRFGSCKSAPLVHLFSFFNAYQWNLYWLDSCLKTCRNKLDYKNVYHLFIEGDNDGYFLGHCI